MEESEPVYLELVDALELYAARMVTRCGADPATGCTYVIDGKSSVT